MSSRPQTATTTTTSTASIASTSSAAPEHPVSTITEWHTEDDLENDLWAYSVNSLNKDDLDVPTPATILKWNAQLEADRKSSIFDTCHEVDDEVTYVFSGRGRGGVSKLYRPGEPVESDLMEEKFIERKLREVSGLGYSNEYIESIVRTYQKNYHDFVDAEADLTGALFAGPSTPRSSHNSPIGRGDRPRQPPATAPHQEYHLPYPSGQTVVVEEVEEEDSPATPPPLSVILGRSRTRATERNSAEQPPQAQSATDESSATLSSSTADDSSVSNEILWTNIQNTSSNSETDASEESLSWRRRPRDSSRVAGFNASHWRRDSRKKENLYDIDSTNDFPPLG